MNYRWLCFAGILSFAALFAGPVAAASPIDKENALDADFNTLIGHAQTAFTEGDFEAAVEYLVIANRLEDEPRLFLNIARSYEELDQCHISLAYYPAFLKEDIDDESLIDRAESAIENGATDCDEFHDGLGGRLLLESEPRPTRVYIDDIPYGLTPTETAGLEPGTYNVRFVLVGYDDFSAEIVISAGQEREVHAAMQEEVEEDEQDVRQEVAPLDEPSDDDGFAPNPVALGLTGAGAAALITGAVFDFILIPGVDDEREQALEDDDHDLVADLTRRRETYANAAVAGYVTGGALIVGGVIWLGYDYWHATSGEDSDSLSWRVLPGINSDGAGVWMLRRF